MKIKTSKIEAIRFAGSQRLLSDLLGIQRQSVTTWGEDLPQSSAQKLYILTNGEIGNKIDESEASKNSDNKQNKTSQFNNINMHHP